MWNFQAVKLFIPRPDQLQRCYVFSLRAFLTLRDRELDLLAFGERLEAVALDCAEMRKHIGAVFLLNKAEALRIVEPLDGSGNCRHS